MQSSLNFGIVSGVARPKGFRLNLDAFEDLLTARHRTRSEVALDADMALSSLSGLTRRVDRTGASLKVALRLAEALTCRPGTLFPELEGQAFAAADEVSEVAVG